MKIFEVLLYMIFLLVGIVIARSIFLGMIAPNPVEAGSATKFLERATGSVWLASDPEVKVSNKKLDGGSEYTVDAILNMRFDGKGTSEMSVIPTVSFKGEKVRDIGNSEITLKSGETKFVTMQFRLISREPPIKICDKSTEFRCADYTDNKKLDKCIIQDKQRLLLKDFSFDFRTFQIDPSTLPYAPPYLPKIGPCALVVEVQCPSDKRSINLKTPEEGELCKDQDNIDDCSKTAKMCGTLANVRLEKIITRESWFEEIAPGTPQCSDKFFAMNIDVGDVEKSRFEWKVGEDITFMFWEKSDKKEQENCWQEDTPECRKLFIGQKTIAIPVESYVMGKCE